MKLDSPDALISSEFFVRALKSATDPPYDNSPSKIHIARHGWDSKNFYVPRKADLLLEWILTRFHRERSTLRSPGNPLLDSAHWSLLADILAHPEDTHIIPLITRISIPGIVSSFLALCSTVPCSSLDLLFVPVLRSLNVLWPLAVRRASIDTLLECLWTILAVFSQLCNSLERNMLVDVLTLVFNAFTSALDNANSAGKKKAYLTFVQHQLQSWLGAMQLLPPTHPLYPQLYSLGVKILMHPDSLRTSVNANFNTNTSPSIFSTLFDNSIGSDQSHCTTLLNLLPSLAKSYIVALRKHHPTIYTGTQAGKQVRERLRLDTMHFVNACLVFLKDQEIDQERVTPIWVARVGLLTVVEEEYVFNYEDSEIVDGLKEVGCNAIKILDMAWDGSHFHLVTHVIDAVACLHRIEPDLLIDHIPQILERLATCSPAAGHSNTLLSQLVSYHSKTRTLHNFTSLLLAAVVSTFPFLPPLDIRTIYGTLTCSPLLSHTFLDELSTSIRVFITPGQAQAIVGTVHSALESSLLALDTPGEPARKRRKVTVIEKVEMRNSNQAESTSRNVLKFTLVARLCPTILTAVLCHGARGGVAELQKSMLDRMDQLIAGALVSSFDLSEGRAGKASKRKKRKRAKQEEIDMQWCRECFSTTLLRLWCDLFVRSRSLGTRSEGRVWDVPETLDHMQDDLTRCLHDRDVQPELQLEIGRVLYACGPSSQRKEGELDHKRWPEFDVILNYIEENLFVNDSGSVRTDFDTRRFTVVTRRHAALTLWGLTLERHLFMIDTYASPIQLERLVDLMIRERPSSEDKSFPCFVLSRAMASASFWEFANIRTSFLAVLEKHTAELASIDIQKWLCALVRGDTKVLSSINTKSFENIQASVQIYRLLHRFPPEYLFRSSRSELAKRALAADILLQVLGLEDEASLLVLGERQAILRSFVVMITTQAQIKFFDETASVQDWVSYLTRSSYRSQNEMFINSTLSLLSLIYVTGLRAASADDNGNSLIQILSHFILSMPFSEGSSVARHLAQQSLLRFIRILVCGKFNVSSYSAGVQSLFAKLCTELDGSLKVAIRATASRANKSEFLDCGHIIEAWQVLLSFKQWLAIRPDIENFGEKIFQITAHIIGSKNGPVIPDEFCANVLSLIIQQGCVLPEEECRHIYTICSAYILFATSTPANSPSFDNLIAYAVKTLSVVQFCVFLDLVAQSMEADCKLWSERELDALLHLSKLLLREAPEKTSKASHEHIARCLRVFVNQPRFTNSSSELSAQVLEFIRSQCSEKAASLTNSDTACIWIILSRLLVCSEHHDESTTTSIFQSAVSIVNSLIRSRRDLMRHQMPQLSMILRQLIMVIRAIRPLLGSKQQQLVRNKLPRWINLKNPLGEDEARTLARVLTALTIKSVVRRHAPNHTQRVESLARPFARHAPYVLSAYIQLMNDPLSVLSVTMRRELEPGLFALCRMMGEHGRDTLMVQLLDVGGKAVLKSLWKGYEKQRYVGGG